MKDFIKNTEEEFLKEYTSFKNGNIQEFKFWLTSLTSDEIIIFIRWLYAGDLKL